MSKQQTNEPFYAKFTQEKLVKSKPSKEKGRKFSDTQRSPHITAAMAAAKQSYPPITKTAEVQHAGVLFPQLDKETLAILESFDAIVQSVLPLTPARLSNLPRQIRELSHGLTDERSERKSGYMNTPAESAAYIRYFMWWNLVRMVYLFKGIPFRLNDGDYAVDLGSGPLTVVIALWIAKPELRSRRITWYCIDASSSILSAGEEIFLSLAAYTNQAPWKIVRIKGGPNTTIKQKAALVTCANMMNELFWDNRELMEVQAKEQTANLTSYCSTTSAILIIEPGIPRSARFISLMRDSLMKKKYIPVLPCPHTGNCPMNGIKGGKWCHFVFPADRAPAALLKRSTDSGLPKERLALSFLYAVKDAELPSSSSLAVRVASDEIVLPGQCAGRYGCSSDGLVLLRYRRAKNHTATPESGSLLQVSTVTETSIHDTKSGASIIDCAY